MNFVNLSAREYQLVARLVTLGIISLFSLGVLVCQLFGFWVPVGFLGVLIMVCIFLVQPKTKDQEIQFEIREVMRLGEYISCSFYAFGLAIAGLVSAFVSWPGRLYWSIILMIVIMLGLGAIQMWRDYFRPWERMVFEFGVPLVVMVIGRDPVGGVGWEIAVYCVVYAAAKFFFVDLLLNRRADQRTLFTGSMHGFVAGGWTVFSLSILIFLIPIVFQVFFF